MAILRAVLAFLILTLGGIFGWLAGVMETCTGNAPDSLLGFIITLPLNVVGVALLCWKPHRIAVILAGAIPVLLSFSYLSVALKLLAGIPACTIITGMDEWPPTGDETKLGFVWLATALILWIGLATALAGGYRGAHDRHDDQAD
ncbi:hypothetical protein [Alteriqipengyuania sp.]|uniref:hypothetical protein n=1 Tax=Alteriqipengyuania sp. TaxID=2800692 RepID=UPI003518A43E